MCVMQSMMLVFTSSKKQILLDQTDLLVLWIFCMTKEIFPTHQGACSNFNMSTENNTAVLFYLCPWFYQHHLSIQYACIIAVGLYCRHISSPETDIWSISRLFKGELTFEHNSCCRFRWMLNSRMLHTIR